MKRAFSFSFRVSESSKRLVPLHEKSAIKLTGVFLDVASSLHFFS